VDVITATRRWLKEIGERGRDWRANVFSVGLRSSKTRGGKVQGGKTKGALLEGDKILWTFHKGKRKKGRGRREENWGN